MTALGRRERIAVGLWLARSRVVVVERHLRSAAGARHRRNYLFRHALQRGRASAPAVDARRR